MLNLAFVADRYRAYVEALVRRSGIPSMAAFNALEIVRGEAEPLPPSLIAERMIVSRGTVTAILDSLESRGLIRRRSHARDGRMRLVEVTPEGSARSLSVLPELHRAERWWLAGLPPAEQHELLRLLALLQRRISQGRPPTAEAEPTRAQTVVGSPSATAHPG